ncbi:MAG: LPS-assembly protein LptD [Puniceicoccales bacterium]|nr:LPS-assembly protein LptD [Puniceicoccales bacterium]
MISSPKWLFAAAMLLPSFAAPAAFADAGTPSPWSPDAPKSDKAANATDGTDEEESDWLDFTGRIRDAHTLDGGNIVVLTTTGVVPLGNFGIEAGEFRFNRATKTISTDRNVWLLWPHKPADADGTDNETKIYLEKRRLLTLGLSIRETDDATSVSARQFRIGAPPGYIKGEVLHIGAVPAGKAETEAKAMSAAVSTDGSRGNVNVQANTTAKPVDILTSGTSGNVVPYSTKPDTGAVGAVAKTDKKTTAKSAADNTTTLTLDNATIYYQEPDFFSLSVDASRITFTVVKKDVPADGTDGTDAASGTDGTGRRALHVAPESVSLKVEDAVVRFAGIPVFYLPSFSQNGLDSPPLSPDVRFGEKDSLGSFLRTTTYYHGYEERYSLTPGFLFDAYIKAGILVGPALDYDTRHLAKDQSPTPYVNDRFGSFMGAWIHDSGRRGTDNYGAPIDAQRGFLVWNHKQRQQGVELTASLNYWSDTSVLRDFRPGEFHRNQRPDSFVELTHSTPFYALSAFTRYRPNDFENVRQRLPEVRLDMHPLEIADTGIYQRLNASVAYLYERTSPELPFIGAVAEDSPRFDAYYGLTRPVKPVNWFSFTPVAGVRATTYFDTPDDDGTYTRLLPQLGFDMHLHAQGQWEYDNDFWEIHGLRHQLRPVVQYRWIPAADKGRSHIPAIDDYVFLPYPPPIDLAQKRYADDLWEQQILRLGVENTFETRDPEYGSRSLAWLNFYQDFRDTDRAATRTRSTTHTQFGLAPARWLNLEIYHRLDTYTGHSNEVSTRLTIRDGDRWRLWFGSQYITDIANTSQCHWGIEYRLNTNYTLTAQWRFDNDVNKLTEQHYAVRQRLGHTWFIEYYISHREDARQDSGFSFGANVRMVSF